MDILAHVLQTAGLRKRILVEKRCEGPWSFDFPCGQSFGFHVVIEGRMTLHTETLERELLAGDIAFMRRGCHHQLSVASGQSAYVVNGAYQLWHDPMHFLFQDLPRWHFLTAQERRYGNPIQQCLGLLSAEVEQKEEAAAGVKAALLDLLFHYIFREISAETPGYWQKTLEEPLVLAALKCMHQQPEVSWSVESLAQQVGLSRSGFSNRFKAATGETPLKYLTALRMSLAMRALSEGDETLTAIAHQVGYNDVFAFSKAFKRRVGQAPQHFRQQEKDSQQLSWRF